MITDERSSLSWQRAVHGPGVDDWTWGRWYWCQDDAVELDRWTAYGYPGWETEDGVAFSGAGYLIQVGRRPEGRLGEQAASVDLGFGRYAVSRVSPFPGLESHGRDEWYADGLPRSELAPFDVLHRCTADVWASEMTVGVLGDSEEGLVMGGGVEVGGGELVPPPGGLIAALNVRYLLPFFTVIDKPSVVQPGDVVVIAYATQTGIFGLTPIPGFTVLASGGTVGQPQHWAIVSRVIDGTEPAFWQVETPFGNEDVEAFGLFFRGAGDVQVGPIFAGTDDDVHAAGLIPTGGGLLFAFSLMNTSGSVVIPAPPGMQELLQTDLAARNIVWLQAWPTTAPTGDRDTSLSPASKRVTGMLLVNFPPEP